MSHPELRPVAKELEDLGEEAEVTWFVHFGEEGGVTPSQSTPSSRGTAEEKC